MEDKVHSFGKIRYVEPNDFLNDELYGNGSFNIIHPYENYSLSVDLTVKIPNRLGTATNNDNTHEIILGNKHFNGDNLSFFSGSNGILTNTPGTTTYYDILNGNMDSLKESLGITNIHIAYNSYFYPEVTIKFSDVRGSALMMPHEENYRRNEINKSANKREYTTQVENFFTALFSFPYPEFILQVKGFYGKKIEYSLLVSDFRSSFNNQTGNFDATVKFIGKMYGVYTDIPMSYLLIAPYCRYGGVNNKTIWEEHGFTLEDGTTPMPTFIELRDMVITANGELKKNMSFKSNQDYQNVNNLKNLLQSVKSAYNSLKEYLILNFKNESIVSDDVLLFETVSNECKYLYQSETNELMIKTQKLHELISQYNTQSSSTKLPYLKNLNGRNDKIGDKNKGYVSLKKEQENDIISTDVDVLDLSKLPSLKNKLCSKYRLNLKNSDLGKFYVVDGIDLSKTIKKLETYLNKELKRLQEEVANDATDKITEILGFSPSIKNIFKILMAHLQTFVEIYAHFVSNVTDTNARDLSAHGLSMSNTVDIPSNKITLDKIQIPPFPAIKDNNTNEFCYPNQSIITGEMEETKLIDALLDGAVDFMSDLENSEKLLEEYEDTSSEVIPTCLTDLIIYDNPYEYAFKTNNNTIDIDWIYTFFGIRCISYLMLEQNKKLNPSEFGKCEAYNFWRVNRNLKNEIINKIKSSDCNSTQFINFLLGEHFIKGEKPCYAKNSATSKLLTLKENGNLMLTGDFNFPAVIGREQNAIDTFFDDMSDIYSGCFNFKKGSSKMNRPHGLIQFIDTKALHQIENKLNSLDLSNYCSDEIKKTFVSNYIENTKGVFNDKFVEYKEANIENFVLRYSSFDNFKSKMKLSTLKKSYEDNFSKGKLSSIVTRQTNIPIFLKENLSSEDFLLSIPIDIQNLASIFKNGKTVITIPYVTKLFIGMVVNKLFSVSKSEFITFINKIATSHGVFNKQTQYEYFRDLFIIISSLFRSKNKEYYDILFNIAYDDSIDNPSTVLLNDIYDNRNFFEFDFLKIKDSYLNWVNNTKNGFAYLKNNYLLKDGCSGSNTKWEVICDVNDKEKKYTGKGNTFYDRLLYACENHKDIDKIVFDKAYSCVDTNKQSETSFSDRYSNVAFITTPWYSLKNSIVRLTFNENFTAYKTLESLFQKTEKLVLPYTMDLYEKVKKNENGKTNIVYGEDKPNVNPMDFHSAFKEFKSKLLELYENLNNESSETKNINISDYSSQTVTEESKLTMYRTLKNLYDRHFSSIINEKDNYDIENKDGEFSRFHFIDTFYRDLSDDLKFNLDVVIDLITIITDGYQNGSEGFFKSEMSVYSFMSLLCEKHEMLLLALPVFNSRGEENLKSMFTPIPFNSAINENTMKGPSYVCFYPHQASKHLDIPSSQYADDGFNIVEDLNDTGRFTGPIQISDLYEDDIYTIPAFGVEYGSQKQSIFKNVNVNMDNPQTTEVAVATMFDLAKGKSVDMRKLGFEGQDLFKIYSNYSYTCQVEMMGCAQIQPLMYFQLNNIPMFRGAYIIIQVEHNITPGNMTTTFKGVRINKTKIPMIKNCLSINALTNLLNRQNKTEKIVTRMKNVNNYDVPIIDTSGLMDVEMEISADTLKNDFGNFISFDSGQENGFNNLNPALRKLVYCLVNDMKNAPENVGGPFGININSSTRTSTINDNSKSDHLVNTNGSASERRKKLRGLDAYGNEKSYSELGCAVDIVATKNGVKDKGMPSIYLYNLIIKGYSDYIRQLIWEVKANNPICNDSISNCIHLSSYGKIGENGTDKTNIYVAQAPTFSAYKNPSGLPPGFLSSIYTMAINDPKKLKTVELYNFNSKPTIEDLRGLCVNAGIQV